MKESDKIIMDKNKDYFEKFPEDFDIIHDDPNGIKNWLTKVATKYYCKDHIKVRLNSLVDLIAGGPKGKFICELGCGPGRYALHFHSLGARIVGVDYSPRMLELAKKHRKESGVREEECSFVEKSVLEFDYPEKFDAAIASGLIDYLPHMVGEKLVERMAYLVKKGGQVIITFPIKYEFFNIIRCILRRLQNVYTFYYSNDDIKNYYSKNCLKITGTRKIVGYLIVAGVKN